jgi:hypothetical protein
MFASARFVHAKYALFLPLVSAASLSAFVTLSWPWLVVTGHTPIPFMSDTSATYGVFAVSPKTGLFDVVKITGEFPHARYVSFMVYGGSRSEPFSTLTDYELIPDPGNVNPFLPGEDRAATNRQYTIYAIWEGSGLDPGAYTNVLTVPASEDFINIMMRVYRPDDGLDELGGVPLPRVEIARAAGPVKVPRYGLASDWGDLLQMFGVVRYQEAESYRRMHDETAIEFYHLSREGGLPNADAPYLDAALGATGFGRDAKLAVMRFRPPTFEDRHDKNTTITGTRDVRYYSFCTSDVATGFNSRCISDNELKVDEDGMVTLVVYPSVLEDRVKRSGLNRLLRGHSETASLTYRQLLPDEYFVGSARNVPVLPSPLQDDVDLSYYQASAFIGEYAPTGVYYTGREFEAWLQKRRAHSKQPWRR